MVAELLVCQAIAEKMKTQTSLVLSPKTTAGVIGLKLVLNVNCFDKNGKKIRHLDAEITKQVNFDAMNFINVHELHELGDEFLTKILNK
jgi:hypothetical protein